MVSAADKEQIEMLTKFWNDYGKGILLLIALGLAIGFGWRYWQQQKIQYSVNAAAMFETYYAASVLEGKADNQTLLAKIKQKYSNTPYAALAFLFAAKQSIKDDKKEAALASLQWVAAHGQPATLRQIAKLRAARVLIALKRYKQAEQTLKTVEVKTFLPMIEQVRGQGYLAEGQVVQAKTAFKRAKDAYRNINRQNFLLDMLFQSLN